MPFAQKCRSGFLTFLTALNPQKTYIPASCIFHIWGTSGTPHMMMRFAPPEPGNQPTNPNGDYNHVHITPYR